MFFSVVISVCERDQIFLPRALTSLLNQSFRDFECIVVVDGESPLRPYDPVKMCPKTVPSHVVYRPRSNTIGFRERRHSLELAAVVFAEILAPGKQEIGAGIRGYKGIPSRRPRQGAPRPACRGRGRRKGVGFGT
jgi:hypothetical protein